MALKDITLYFVFVLLIATIGPFLFGYHLSELNAPIAVITCRTRAATGVDANLPQCIPMTSAEVGLVSSIFTLGGLCGALGAGPLSASYGRYKTMLGTTVFHILGPVFEALTMNIGTFTVGRFISGIGAGAALVVVPIYISELSPPKEKGFFGAFTQVMTNVGILTTQVLGLFLSKGQSWRMILAAAGMFGALQAVGLLLAGQESPKWLADHGKPTPARRILRKLRGHAADVDAEVKGWGISSRETQDAEEETLLHSAENGPSSAAVPDDERVDRNKSISKSVAREVLGPFQVLRHPDSRRAVLVVMVVMLAQQLTGINSVVMYGVDVLSDLLAANSALLNVAVAALNVFVTAGSAPLTDRFGRKTCLIVSISVMGVSSLLLGIGIQRHIPVLSAVSVVTYVVGFALGLGPIPFILSSELVNAEAVGSTQSWALAANWISTFVVAQFFPIVNQALGGGKTYFIFAIVALLSVIFISMFLPESKDKSTADEVWGRSKTGRED
ncbi:general substrate transporter [Elsinoe ampelina]|uniref:General substrate transporter n=1 Tax=Elsinoe ampelina TaxID=302913 RepID=A0A6A6G5B5_9PEZI|nr:general substrate transporter [Elsinoe ampelina]